MLRTIYFIFWIVLGRFFKSARQSEEGKIYIYFTTPRPSLDRLYPQSIFMYFYCKKAVFFFTVYYTIVDAQKCERAKIAMKSWSVCALITRRSLKIKIFSQKIQQRKCFRDINLVPFHFTLRRKIRSIIHNNGPHMVPHINLTGKHIFWILAASNRTGTVWCGAL